MAAVVQDHATCPTAAATPVLPGSEGQSLHSVPAWGWLSLSSQVLLAPGCHASLCGSLCHLGFSGCWVHSVLYKTPGPQIQMDVFVPLWPVLAMIVGSYTGPG